jgi:hypothetical protein
VREAPALKPRTGKASLSLVRLSPPCSQHWAGRTTRHVLSASPASSAPARALACAATRGGRHSHGNKRSASHPWAPGAEAHGASRGPRGLFRSAVGAGSPHSSARKPGFQLRSHTNWPQAGRVAGRILIACYALTATMARFLLSGWPPGRALSQGLSSLKKVSVRAFTSHDTGRLPWPPCAS